MQCEDEFMAVVIAKSLFRGVNREQVQLLDPACQATETEAHFTLITPLSGCNTTVRHTPTVVVYSNKVMPVPVGAEGVVMRDREIEIWFSCFYSKSGLVSSAGFRPVVGKTVINDAGQGNFTLTLSMFPDISFAKPYGKSDFPIAVKLHQPLYFEVSVTSGDKQLSISAERCFATPTQDPDDGLKYEFIENGYECSV